MSIYHNGNKVSKVFQGTQELSKIYQNEKLVFGKGGGSTTLVFDKTISDPKNITGYGQGPAMNIIAKMRRCLAKKLSVPEGWQTSISDTSWLPEKDPSPRGWRVPTTNEIVALDAAYRGSWTAINGISGRRFGDSINGPFFPAAGYRGNEGSSDSQGTGGYYWSSTPDSSGATNAYYLVFLSPSVLLQRSGDRQYGMAVRCVRDTSTTDYEPCPAGEVQIGNLIWAKSNLKDNKVFCEKETDYGCLFQWGQNIAIPYNDEVKICYLNNENSTAFWYTEAQLSNPDLKPWPIDEDPSPDGWRIPTSNEIEALGAAYKGGWININGINGRRFGNSTNGPFFSAAGYRGGFAGQVNSVGEAGRYWLLDPNSTTLSKMFEFNEGTNFNNVFYYIYFGHALRCVRDVSTTDFTPCPAGEFTLGNIVWAKSNLAGYKKFCQTETESGAFFQWGKKQAYPRSGSLPTPVLTGNDGDVMVYMPEFWYKRVETNNPDTFSFQISEEPISGGIHVEHSLLGAYKSNNVSSKLYSRSGVAPSINTSQANNITYAKARGVGYNIIDYDQHCMIALLFYAKYGNRDSQAVLGAGGATNSTQNGTTNSRGNLDTLSGTSSTHASFCGIEGVHGGVSEFVSNANINDGIWTVLNSDGTTRTVVRAVQNEGLIREIAASTNDYFDLIPISINLSGNNNLYYTDYYWYGGQNRVFARSFAGTSTFGGVSFTYASLEEATPSSELASRLSFRGKITEENDIATFKALPLL